MKRKVGHLISVFAALFSPTFELLSLHCVPKRIFTNMWNRYGNDRELMLERDVEL